MSTAAHFTLAQYELMVESGAFDGEHHRRVEFIRGEIRERSPLSPRHAWTVDWLSAWSFENTDRGEQAIRPLAFPDVVLKASTLFKPS